MADITLCTSETCLDKECYRETARPSCYQSYCDFTESCEGYRKEVLTDELKAVKKTRVL